MLNGYHVNPSEIRGTVHGIIPWYYHCLDTGLSCTVYLLDNPANAFYLAPYGYLAGDCHILPDGPLSDCAEYGNGYSSACRRASISPPPITFTWTS